MVTRATVPYESVYRTVVGETLALARPDDLTEAELQSTSAKICDLSWILERAENLVSHHLRLLRSEGLVKGRRDGKMVMYSLTARGHAMLKTVLASDQLIT